MARRTLRVTTELIAVEVGHWCNRCLTSAGIRVRYAVAVGPSLCFHTATACQDCEHDDVELVESPTTIWQP